MGKAMVFGAGILALLLLAILLFQLCGISHHYQYYITTGGETHCIYGIWKVQEGHPLYAWPNKDFFQLTLYNFGFYHLYAGILNLLHAHGPEIMLYGRYLSSVLTLLGCLIQVRLLFFLAGGLKSRVVNGAIFLFSFCTWFNSYFPGFYPVSIRPDIAAVAMSSIGVFCFVRYAAANELKWVCAAGAAWAATWCLKQADVACIFGAGVYLVLNRKWRDAVLMSAMFIIPVGLVLMLGSAEYRWNILVAPTANGLDFAIGARFFLRGAVLSLFTWSFVATLPLYLRLELRDDPHPGWRALRERMRPGTSLAPVTALAVIVLSGFVPSFAALSKTGSSLNQMFEIYVVANSLSFIVALRLAALLSAGGVRRFSLAVCLLLLSMCVWPAAQLAMNRIGPVVRARDADMTRKEKFSIFVKSLKKPLFIEDEIYSLPWHGSDNQYPSIKLDHVFYDDALARGMISGGVKDLIEKHWFATIYIQTNTAFFTDAMAAQYHVMPIAPDQTCALDALNKEGPPCVLLVAP